MEITINTRQKRQIIDITRLIEEKLKGEGLVNIFTTHTTAAITTADLDPGGTDQDYLDALEAMTPKRNWNHPHDPAHFPDHLWSSIIGPQICLPFSGNKLRLGSWQRVILIEFDGPRERQVALTIR